MHILTHFPTKCFLHGKDLWMVLMVRQDKARAVSECVFVCIEGDAVVTWSQREGTVSRCGESISARDYLPNGTVVRELHLALQFHSLFYLVVNRHNKCHNPSFFTLFTHSKGKRARGREDDRTQKDTNTETHPERFVH